MECTPHPPRWACLSPSGGTMADMARRTATPPPPEDFEENIIDIDVAEEMRGSYLEYAYSVIYSRALPDARDGLKPVQRRILYQMNQMGLRRARAAMRYTEARLAAAAMEMVASIDEDTVDFRPNYDGQETEPEVLPAALPNLLVNGTAGIAVGMATNMAPHNLGE